METISRRSGGASSALDLAEAFYDLGFDVHIGVTKYPAFIYRIFKWKITSFPFNRVGVVSHNLIESAYKSLLHKLFYLLSFRKINLKSFEKYDYTINVSVLSNKCLKSIKGMSQVTLVKNHPGSVETFRNYWIDKKMDFKVEYLKSHSNYDKILFQSRYQANECETEFPELKGKPIVIEPTCKEAHVLGAKLRQPPYKKNNANTILVNVGSIQPRKGQILSVKVLDELINYGINSELHLVGGIIDNGYLKNIKEEIHNLNLSDKVFIHGHKDNYLDYMAHSDIILQTSYSEGVSRILREGMLLKKPIATFSISGTNDLLDSDSAILATPVNEKELSRKICDALKNNDKMSILSEKAFHRYINNNSKTIYHSNIISTFS